MIPEKSSNSLTLSTNITTANFDIDAEDFAHIVDIIQNQLYSDKPLALIREYSCNAYDANIAAGRKETPVKITLPSKFSPTLKIRDYGDGLTFEQMTSIFIRYGKSNKRNDNTTVGCFGIGSKSGFSYGQSFTVISYVKGLKSSYNCALDERNVGKLILLGNPIDTTEHDGVEININVKMTDIENFRNICMSFFKYWDVLPNIEGFTADDYTRMRGTSDIVLDGQGWQLIKSEYGYGRSNNTVAIMGNIAYPIKWDAVKGLTELIEKRGKAISVNMKSFITDNTFVFRFNIGEVKMSPSRESLQYTDLTNNAILARVGRVLDEVTVVAQNKISQAKNLWFAKIAYDDLFNNYGNLGRLKGGITTTFNGKDVTDSKIRGFETFKRSDGVAPNIVESSILKTYHKRGGNVSFSVYDCSDHSWNTIDCGDKKMVLEVDQIKGVYLQKAVRYLSDTKGVSTVFVLNFKDATQRKTVFDQLGLDDSFITKYSDIATDVKNTIVRGAQSGARVQKESTIRSLRYLDSTMTSTYRYYGVKDYSAVDVDFAEGGIYVETENTSIKDNKYSIRDIQSMVCSLGKHDGKTVTVYFIGQNYVDGTLMKKGTWVKYEDYLKNRCTEIYKNNSNLRLITAFHDIVNNDDTIYHLNANFIEFLKKHFNACMEIKEIVNIFTSKNELAENIVRGKVTVTDDDRKEIKGIFKNILVKFPLFRLFNKSFGYNGVGEDESSVIEYIKQHLTAAKNVV